jgi:RimJ/RimL family protein N-acetyltransferase
MIIPTLYTPNLILRPFAAEDAKSLHRIYQGEGVLRYFPNPIPPPLDKVERFIAYQQNHWEQYAYGNWAVVPGAGGELIGWAGLQYLPETNETEVGYLLDRSQWGKGYATEAARAALQFGFERFDFLEIIALVHPENLTSLRVAAKCGLVPVERKPYWGLELIRHTITRQSLQLASK